jgi:hypothetical protein
MAPFSFLPAVHLLSATFSVLADAIQLFIDCPFAIGDSASKRPKPVISFCFLSDVWMLVCLPSEAIGFGLRDQ